MLNHWLGKINKEMDEGDPFTVYSSVLVNKSMRGGKASYTLSYRLSVAYNKGYFGTLEGQACLRHEKSGISLFAFIVFNTKLGFVAPLRSLASVGPVPIWEPK